MTDAVIPLTCKYCGEALSTPADAAEPGPDTVLSCPVHGPMGRLQDILHAAAIDLELDDFERSLKAGGLSVTRESGD
jgi:hypothetical protein